MFVARSRESGFTLVEVMASLLVFALVTIGIVPLLASAMRGTSLTRSYTVGKNLTQEAMERVRGLPYYISYASQARPADVLDLYYPAYTASGTYTTTCTPAMTMQAACPKRLPTGHEMEFRASFVKAAVSGATEEFDTVVPPTDYAWNVQTKDAPVSNLLRLAITTSWPFQGDTRSFTLESVIGDRKFEALKVTGGAKLDYGVSVVTQFTDTVTGAQSALSAIDGTAESFVESRVTSTADQNVEAGVLTITEAPDDPSVVAENIDNFTGARARLHSPPNNTMATQSVSGAVVTNDQVNPPLQVAGVDGTQATDLSTSVTAELPLAAGAFLYTAQNGVRDLWVTQQLDTLNAAALRLDITRSMFRVQPKTSSGDAIRGKTEAQTTAAGATQKVLTKATYSFRDFGLLPTTFIAVNAINDNIDRAVILIDTFTAAVECNATGTTTSAATATWTATLRYYSAAAGAYVQVPAGSGPTLNQSNAASELAALRSQNPLVFDGLLSTDDIYLFEERDPVTSVVTKKGYLNALSTGAVTTNVSANHDTATAAIEGALRIDTVTLNTSVPGSTINVNVGRMRCEAVERR